MISKEGSLSCQFPRPGVFCVRTLTRIWIIYFYIAPCLFPYRTNCCSNVVFLEFGLILVLIYSIVFDIVSNNGRRGKLWNVVSLAILWMLWLERHNRISEDQERNFDSLWDRVKSWVALWLFEVIYFKGIIFSYLFYRDWVFCCNFWRHLVFFCTFSILIICFFIKKKRSKCELQAKGLWRFFYFLFFIFIFFLSRSAWGWPVICCLLIRSMDITKTS